MSPPYDRKRSVSAIPRAEASDGETSDQSSRATSNCGVPVGAQPETAAMWANLRHLLVVRDSAPGSGPSARP